MDHKSQRADDIAVVGLGLRFPGEATSPEDLWTVLEGKKSQWSPFPEDRLNINGYFHPSGRRQGGISFKGAHFLKEDVASFDAAFFGIPSEEAAAVDPQQRMLLEVSYEALENAGIRKEDVDGGDCAVFVGSFVKDYEQICLRDPDWSPQYAATGNGIAIMANRISYALNLHGPSMTIDTGCSGSLIAVHLAAQALRTGESSLAIAAGAGMILSPNTIMPMTALNFLSPDGKCFTFDSRANGYGRGEGIGAVIMKRLSDALRDNDTIHAVIRSTSTNQDGKTTGITLPSKEAQVANIRNAYAIADLDFSQTAYVECHGTGTQAGDWRELKAISETIAEGRPADRRVVVGSIKPNIGHLEGAAGIAGLIKGVMTLERGRIPPQINFEKGNPNIDFDDWGVKVPTSVLDWPLPGIRRVSVNCFGFGGSNAHVIMDEAPGYLSARGLKGNHSSAEEASPRLEETESHARLFVYSANDKSGVARVMHSQLPYLNNPSLAAGSLKDYAYTLGSRRSNLDWKGFVVADSLSSLRSKLEDFDGSSCLRSSLAKKPKLGFIFCGQGSQWAQMGKDLMSYETFSTSITDASAYLKNVLGSPFDLLEELFKDSANSRISSPEISQPATTALQVAMVDLLSSFGILPEHVVGHSSGEIAAAYAAGALTRESAWKVAYYRGLAAASIPIRAPKLRGGMAVVGMSVSKTQLYLDSVAKSARVACINSPRSVTISGLEEAILWIANDLKEKSVFCKVLEVKTAYHSSHMKLVEYDYRDSLGILTTSPTHENVRMFSSVTGQLAKGGDLTAEYWATNLVSPVQYVAAVESLMSLPSDERPEILIEVSPSAALRSPTSDILGDGNRTNIPKYLSVLERKKAGPESMLTLIGELWARGYPVNMEMVAARGSPNVELKCLSDLPKYPWNHSKRYWYETHLSRANRFRKYPRQDLIGAPTADSVLFEPRWRGFLRISESPWIQDHQVQKTIIYPAAGMVSMVLEGAKQMAAEQSASPVELLGYELSNLVIEKAILVPNIAHGLEVALNIKSESSRTSESGLSGTHQFAIYSKPLDKPWERHASGNLQFRFKLGDWKAGFQHHEQNYNILDGQCKEKLIPRQLYETLDAVGLNYGSSFQNLVQVRKSHNASVSKIRIPDTKSKMPEKFEYPHLLHPVTLDAMFHSLLAIEPVPMVPVAIERLFVSANIASKAGDVFTGHATTSISGVRGAAADIVMRQSIGDDSAFVIIDGLRLTRLSSPSPGTFGFLANHRNLTTQIVWKEDAQFASPSSIVEQIDVLAHKWPSLSVLQVGADISLTRAILNAVTPNQSDASCLARLTITAANDSQFERDVLATIDGTSIAAQVEMVSDISGRGVTYNLIIVGEGSSPANLRSLLQPGGVLLEHTKSEGEPSLTDNQVSVWEETSAEGGDRKIRVKAFKNEIPVSGGVAFGNVIFLVPSKVASPETRSLIDALQKRSGTSGQPELNVGDLVKTPELISGRVVVSLLETSASETEDFIVNWREEDFAAFHTLQAEAASILWITRGANMIPQNPKAAPIIALARTLMSEDPLKQVVTLDLGFESQLDDPSVVESFFSVFNAAFCTKIGNGPPEVEYAEQGGKIYIPRLTTIESLNRMIEDENFGTLVRERFDRGDSDESGLELDVSKIQLFEDSAACFTAFVPDEMAEDEVEIGFLEAPLSFLDVETVLGRTSDTSVGLDVRGTVKRVGGAVADLAPGDEVMALVAGNAIRNTLNVKAQFAKRNVPGVVPSMLVSAYYALFHVGRLSRGRKVLIHAGASAHGLAAIQLAQHAGADIFTTVLGSDTEQQRSILEQRGISHDRILDADADGFVMALLASTNGKGVDVVYNPTLAFHDANLRVVRKSGTVVSFADKSPAPQSWASPSGSMTVVSFDLRSLLEQDADFVAELFNNVTPLYEALSGDAKAPNVQYDVESLKDLLQHIQRAPFVGNVSAVANLKTESKVEVFSQGAGKPLDQFIHADGTYLLSGGLGGLGKSITELLVKNGAKHIAYISRSGASSESAKAYLEDLQARGIDARAFAVDICNSTALEGAIKGIITKEMPQIRGVFQCAAVIRDAVFDNMTFEDWDAAMKPKTVGSWNLLQAMDAAAQDPFFVFLSSSAGVIGNRGQANYASGNCFQDALARHLRLNGKRACSLDLGPILGAGMLAENDQLLDILRASGFYGIRHGDFLKVVEHAITGEVGHPAVPMPAQVILGVGTGGIIQQNQPADPYWSRTALYSYLNLVDMPPADLSDVGAGSSNMDMRSMLARAVDIDAATSIICTGLSSMLAKSMNLHVEEVDVNRPPSNYGVDSLVAVSVRNWVLGNCGVQISVFEILGDLTIVQLSHSIAEKSGCGQ